MHERVGAHAAGRAGVLLVGGEFAEVLARGALNAKARSDVVRISSQRATPRGGCATTPAAATSCCSRARECTGWRRSLAELRS